MPQALHITGPHQADGNLDVTDLWVGPQGVLTSTSGLEVWSEGNVVVFGTVRGEPGAELSLNSRSGHIIVLGSVINAAGLDGGSPGKAGQKGGSIHLSAPRGEILIAGRVQAGAGGNGAAAANFPLPSDTRGGQGGAGGEILLKAGRISIRAGRLVAGNGGHGGEASADGADPAVLLQWILEHTRPGGITDPHPQPPPLPELLDRAEILNSIIAAFSGHAGPGGDIQLTAGASGWALQGAVLQAGQGGNTLDAKAVRAMQAASLIGLPGPGGKIAFDLSGAGGWQRNAREIPGEGGSAGSAIAAANEVAEMQIRSGGEGGRVYVQGTPATAPVKGGDVGSGRVTTAHCNRSSAAALGAPGLPAAGSRLKCP